MVQDLMCNKLSFKSWQLRFKSYSLKGMYKNKGKDISLKNFL